MKQRASNAGVWANCPASLHLPEIPQTDFSAADRGTELHRRAILALEDREYQEEFRDLIEFYDSLGPKDGEFFERDLSEFSSVESATPDIWFYRGNKITVIDLKFGFVQVDAVQNWQLLTYSNAAKNAMTIGNLWPGAPFEAELIIYQPSGGGEAVRRWDLGAEEFNKWGDHWVSRSQEAKALRAQRTGDHCKYCPSKFYCESYVSRGLDVLEVETQNPTPPCDLLEPDADAILKNYEDLKAKEKVVKELRVCYEEWLKARIAGGDPVKGVTLNQTSGKRVWDADLETIRSFQKLTGLKLLEERPISITEALKDKDYAKAVEGSLMKKTAGKTELIKYNPKKAQEIFK